MVIDIICHTCGSSDVSRDAWADWDSDVQEWKLRTVFDFAYCNRCDVETRLDKIPLIAANESG